MLFLRITFQLDRQTALEDADLERFAASATAAMPTLRFLALATAHAQDISEYEDEWYDDVYGLGGHGSAARWWRTVSDGCARFVRPMAAADGERIWRALIDEDEVCLEDEEEEQDDGQGKDADEDVDAWIQRNVSAQWEHMAARVSRLLGSG